MADGNRPRVSGAREPRPTVPVDGEPAEPKSWGELYLAVSGLTLQAQTGGAEQALNELETILASAREEGALRIIHRALYVASMCNLRLNRLDECLTVSNKLTSELSDDPVDRSYLSSAASMRALVSTIRSAHAEALASLVEAAIHLQDAPLRSPGYLNAVNGLGVGYLAIRLYEPALEQYQRSRDDELFAESRVPSLFRTMNAQLAHLYWGLELDRVGSDDASAHFSNALTLGEQALEYLPTASADATWESLLDARAGLCLAFLGEGEKAIQRLEPVLEPLARRDVDEAVMARLGLVRAYADLDHRAALAQSERAMLSVGHTTDYAPAHGVAWEHVRLHLGDSGARAAANHARLLARASWDECIGRAASVAERIAAESARLAEARDTERLFFDAATGLPNRLSFTQRLAGDILTLDAEASIGVALLDFPNGDFHRVFDEVIATLAVDFVARSGPSELSAVAVGLDATELARRVEACSATGRLGMVAGIASLRTPPSAAGLLMHADEALLAARKIGGVVVNPFSSEIAVARS